MFTQFPQNFTFEANFHFFTLKLFSNQKIYKWFFFRIVKISHLKKIKFILQIFYPSLKFKIAKFRNIILQRYQIFQFG